MEFIRWAIYCLLSLMLIYCTYTFHKKSIERGQVLYEKFFFVSLLTLTADFMIYPLIDLLCVKTALQSAFGYICIVIEIITFVAGFLLLINQERNQRKNKH